MRETTVESAVGKVEKYPTAGRLIIASTRLVGQSGDNVVGRDWGSALEDRCLPPSLPPRSHVPLVASRTEASTMLRIV